MRRLLDEGTEALAQLGSQAIATGNLETAERLADEALRRDPTDPTALAVQKQLDQVRASAAEAPESGLHVRKFQSEQAAPPQPEEVDDLQPRRRTAAARSR